MDTADAKQWSVDKTINLPSVFSLLVVAVTGIWWLANIQSLVNENTKDIMEWKLTWAQFLANREVVVRSYEQFKATQEQVSREIIRRLDELRAEQLRVGENLLRREEELRRGKP